MLCMVGFLTLHLSVHVSVDKICQKELLSRSTSFLVEAFLVTHGGNHSILKKEIPMLGVL